jgi:hypothetical protein
MGQAKIHRQAEIARAMAAARVTSRRIAIIEWLDENERHTGTELKERLERRSGHEIPTELYLCRTKDDVFRAIASITDSVRARGTPILHIEAHGSTDYSGFIGPTGEAITWRELSAPLRALNIETRFNLVVVAAACLSEAILFAVEMPKPLPYLAAVCFRTLVTPNRLLEAMLELYRALVLEKLSLASAVERADSELSGSEFLRFTSVPMLLKSAAEQSLSDFDNVDSGAYYARMAARVTVATGKPMQYTPAQFARVMRIAAIDAVGSALHRSLDYDHFPENRYRFGFDPKEFVDERLRARLQKR